MVGNEGHFPDREEPDDVRVMAPIQKTSLKDCREVCGELNKFERRGHELQIVVHDRQLAYPLDSEEARTLQGALGEVPIGTHIGLLCLTIDGRSRLFVRVEGGEG